VNGRLTALRFDTHGNAVDAHDGQLARFGHDYYLESVK
jgi:hypothetical protein